MIEINEQEAAARVKQSAGLFGHDAPGGLPVGTGRLILALSVTWSAIGLTAIALIGYIVSVLMGVDLKVEMCALLLGPLYLWAGQSFEKYFGTRNGKSS